MPSTLYQPVSHIEWISPPYDPSGGTGNANGGGRKTNGEFAGPPEFLRRPRKQVFLKRLGLGIFHTPYSDALCMVPACRFGLRRFKLGHINVFWNGSVGSGLRETLGSYGCFYICCDRVYLPLAKAKHLVRDPLSLDGAVSNVALARIIKPDDI